MNKQWACGDKGLWFSSTHRAVGLGVGAALQGLRVEALAREWMYFLSKRCQQIGQISEYGTMKTPYPLPKSRFRIERGACEGDGEGVDREFRRQLYDFSVIEIKGDNILKPMLL